MAAYSKEARQELGNVWPALVMAMLLGNVIIFLYSLFTLTFHWFGVAFFVLFLLIAHRYGTLLEEAENRGKERNGE